jgi:hypothetical protein
MGLSMLRMGEEITTNLKKSNSINTELLNAVQMRDEVSAANLQVVRHSVERMAPQQLRTALFCEIFV